MGGRRLKVEVPGVDPGLFPPHPRHGGRVVVCSAYYRRKAGELWLEVARRLPHRGFVVLGRGWSESPLAESIAAATNVSLVEAPYDRYPAIYARCDVFLSTSTLEGGPMPLIETMLANIVPVVSATGFAPDVVAHGETGFLFPVGAEAGAIAELVENAYSFTREVRSAVEHLTPARYAAAVWSELEAHRDRRSRNR